jgi:hypothetical protein
MELTSDEKRAILESHIKNALTNIYNLQISLLAEQAKENPNSDIVNNLSEQKTNEEAKRDVLLQELENLPND